MTRYNAGDDGRYVIVAPGVAPAGVGSLGIEQCAGCSSLGTETPTTPQAAVVALAAEKPWWFWSAVGLGLGAAAYLVLRSGGLLSNPGKQSEMQITQDAAALAVQAGLPVILWGSPGIGKTSWLEALGELIIDRKGHVSKVFTIIGSTKDPTDIGGMPKADGSLQAPSWAEEIRARSLDGRHSVLFLDEFSSMTPIVHAALLRVVREKIAGECDLDPANGPLKGQAVHVVCAGNPRGEGAAAIDLPPPAANRMLHIDWPVPSPIAYGLGLVLGWPTPKLLALPEDWRSSPAMKSAKGDITSFVQRRTGLLFDFPDKDKKKSGRAWPSPRSWELAAEVLGAARAAGASLDVQAVLVRGAVGDAAGGEFLNWLEDMQLPDPEAILLDPGSWTPPEDRSDVLWAVANSISFSVMARKTPERVLQAWEFIRHVTDHDAGLAHSLVPLTSDLAEIINSFDAKIQGEIKKKIFNPSYVGRFFDLWRTAGFMPDGTKKKD
jgi:hypothetical protein